MKNPNKTRRLSRFGKFFLYSLAAVILLFVLKSVTPWAVDKVLDRLERQREAELNYNCAHYGAAMNKHYGRDVCEDEAVHKANL